MKERLVQGEGAAQKLGALQVSLRRIKTRYLPGIQTGMWERATTQLELGGRKGVKGTILSRKRGKRAQRSCQDARPHAAMQQGQNSTHRQAEGNEATKRGRTVELNGLPVI